MPGGTTPHSTPETQPYWEAAARGQLSIQRCNTCGKHYFYPRSFCRYCTSRDVEWTDVSGRARLVSYVINYRPRPPADPSPQVIALVELEEGPRMLTNILMDDPTPDQLVLDSELFVDFEARDEGISVPVFRLVATA
jgi:uncharacterized protein